MNSIPRLLKIIGGGYPFLFGRVKVNGNYQIGKVHAGAGRFLFSITVANKSKWYEDDFEVLTCSSKAIRQSPCGNIILSFFLYFIYITIYFRIILPL